jgi:ubiquinone/menaquinone biosynthesis C-methylase UbiE
MDLRKTWNDNAPSWSRLSRQGYDTYRDAISSPAFFDMLPDVHGLKGLDVGTGEGYNSQKATENGAQMIGLDLSDAFCREAADRNTDGLSFLCGDARSLPFRDGFFDFCISTMAFMDFPEQVTAMKEVYRILKPGGFFQFSILHPFYDSSHGEWVRNEAGEEEGYLIRDYFRSPDGDVDEWMFSALPPDERKRQTAFKTPRHNLSISEWITGLAEIGFKIEECREPRPSQESVSRHPNIRDALIMPYFLILRSRK